MSKSIFVVDADTGFTDNLTTALSARGFTTQVVSDGKDALDQAKAAHPDLVVLCVELPKMSGYSVCNKLKKDEELKGIPLIITSSEATPETFEQHKKLKTRAEDYIIKPFEPDMLIDKIGALIGLPEPAEGNGAEEDVVASGGDELDFDSLTASPEDAQPIEEAEEDPLAALGGEELDEAPAPEPPPPPPKTAPAAAAKAKSTPAPPKDVGADLDDLLGPSPAAAPAKSAAAKPAPAVRPAPAARPSTPPAARASAPPVEVVKPDPQTEQALKESRKENSDLKAKIAALETRLKQADEQAQRLKSEEGTGRAGAASAAKDILHLKEQLNARDKELLALKDEVFTKEKEIVEKQEELAEIEARTQTAESVKADLEEQVATLNARVESSEQQLNDAETRVADLQNQVAEVQAQLADSQNQLADAHAQLSETQTQLSDTQTQLGEVQARAAEADTFEAELGELRIKLDDTQNSLAASQDEAQKNEERAVKAYQKLKQDEKVREKLRRALDIAQQLVSGSVVDEEPDADVDLDASIDA